MRELIFDDDLVVKRTPAKRAASTRRRACAHIIATNVKTGAATRLPLFNGTNSFGEPNVFIGKPKQKEFEALRGYPLYATQTWLVSNGYRYEVT